MQNAVDESQPTGLHAFSKRLGTEYYKLFETVNEFDKRLLTVKGWGVTVSLLALAWGFQDQHYGLFLVAAISGVAFWLLEAVVKQHQMRYYVRMREIEIISFELFSVELQDDLEASTPQIDWSWGWASEYFTKKKDKGLSKPERYEPKDTFIWKRLKKYFNWKWLESSFASKWLKASYPWTWLFPHVAFPHVVSVIVGGGLFIQGTLGRLDMPL